MNLSEVADVLTALQPIHNQDALTEELGDLTAQINITDLSESDLRALLSQIYQHPRVFSDCSVDVQESGSSNHLFRITARGVTLNESAFHQLGDDTLVNGPDYESRLSAHSTNNRDSQLIDTLVDLLTEVEEQTSYSIDFPAILDKTEIGEIVLENTVLEGLHSDDVHLHFWFDVANLRTWLDNRLFASYGARFFPPGQMPLLIYFQNSGSEIDGTSLFPVSRVTDGIAITQEAYQEYQERISLAGENTTFRNGAPVLTPALFTDAPTLAELFQTATIYGIFTIFSDRVTQQGDRFEFYTKQGPESVRSEVDIDAEAIEVTTEQLAALRGLYGEFAEREDRKTFVGFWRRSVIQQCESITTLSTAVDDIRDHYRFIEAETVEGNFDDLSDAVRDTHAFMTGITSQVADTTTALSNEIQRLVFTLLGAILANLFLILRWGNIDMVIPFSLFVVSAILVFYCPLIDRRVEELDEIKSKGEEDYSTYNDLITGFTGEAFDFSELEDRKDEYITYADQRLAWARRNLRRIHTALLLTGLGFVALATSRYSPDSTQVALAAVFVAAVGYLTVRIWTIPNAHSYHQIELPHRGSDDDPPSDDHLYTNHLPFLVGIGSLALILLNILTQFLPR